MGENSSASTSNDEYELKEIRTLLWGPSARDDVFRRWSQGFEFSEFEPSALVQRQGGPCAVLAPVQAFLLKILLMETPGHSLKDLTSDKCNRLLIQALCDILMKCKVTHYRIVTLPEVCAEAKESTSADVEGNTNQLSPSPLRAPDAAEGEAIINQPSPAPVIEETAAAAVESIADTVPTHVAPPEPQQLEWSAQEYHDRLSVLNLETIEQVEKYYTDNFITLSGNYGVLLFMYTVLLTKGIENVLAELSDTSEPLIHNTYGYGSQGLINLMLTGRAVAHVWDNHQDVGGLRLLGINQQADVGFITLMETMRYCTVGSFFKDPKNPVWVMGSETHLSVLFSSEKRLVSPETQCDTARRVFKSYDPDGNNFIPTPVLQDVLCALELVSEPEYVEIMQRRLDQENLGIILLNAFMDEFFPEDNRSVPDTFDLMHYNGIPGSNDGNMVKYSSGKAILLESDLKSVCISNLMLTVLQTKWPTIDVNWGDIKPSLN